MERVNKFSAIICVLLVIILLNCGCTTPSDNPKSSTDVTGDTNVLFEKNTDVTTTIPEKVVGKTTLKNSWNILSTKSEAKDLKFYGYLGYNLDNEGKTYNYTIVGYSPSQDKSYAMKSDINGLKYVTNENPNIDKYYDINEIKDSPQIVEEALKAKGSCGKSIRIIFSTDNARAEVTCLSEWAIVDYEYLK